MFCRNLAVASLFVVALFAGCLSGEDVETDEENGDGAEPQEGLGSIRGTIVTINLEPIEEARVQLVKDSELVAEATTDAQGEYKINNIEPGDYRFQVTAPCCREYAQGVEVKEDELGSVSAQLDPFTEDDLQLGRVEKLEWTGFLACTLRWPTGGVVPYSGVNACGAAEIVAPGATDDDFLHVWEIQEGLKSVVGGMSWRAPGAALGDELALYMEVNGRPNQQPRYTYVEGQSPLEWRVDAGWVVENVENEDLHRYDFNNIEGTEELMFRIFAGGDVNVVYQQQFTAYWDLYYWEAAPEGATSLPDA